MTVELICLLNRQSMREKTESDNILNPTKLLMNFAALYIFLLFDHQMSKQRFMILKKYTK